MCTEQYKIKEIKYSFNNCGHTFHKQCVIAHFNECKFNICTSCDMNSCMLLLCALCD